MLRKIILSLVIILACYFLIIQYLSIESDPCDIECDNCINPEQCIECYEECYSRTI